MKKKIAKLWAKALRSGKYKQIKGQLANKDGYCCLGVLCELAIENGVKVSRKKVGKTILFDGQKDVLPKSVMKWAGIKSSTGIFHFELKNNREFDGICLAYLNDNGYSFKNIAHIIKKYWL
jgi:hypothetical protein